jgi:hypothetical protein
LVAALDAVTPQQAECRRFSPLTFSQSVARQRPDTGTTYAFANGDSPIVLESISSERDRVMLIRLAAVLIRIACALLFLGTSISLAQRSDAVPNERPAERAIFDNIGLTSERGSPVVKLLPVQDKREVAVCGLVNLQVPAEVFLQSFRESMVRRSNSAILEIGRFSGAPTIEDLHDFTVEPRDIEDLKECVAGDCKVKLSAGMIDRFRKEIDWTASDYGLQVTQLFKQILLNYIREYSNQGDAALIEYNDQPKSVLLAEETHSLIGASTFSREISGALAQHLHEYSLVENALVWSKIKFGLKPVIAINHILIYQREQTTGPKIIVVSKQIYANHYFDASLAVTAFGDNPNESNASYLFYENRSRVDGLVGLFGKLKRRVIEDQAVDSLTTILDKSKASLTARTSGQPETVSVTNVGSSWKRRITAVTQASLLIFLISAFVALLVFSQYGFRGAKPSALSKRKGSPLIGGS